MYFLNSDVSQSADSSHLACVSDGHEIIDSIDSIENEIRSRFKYFLDNKEWLEKEENKGKIHAELKNNIKSIPSDHGTKIYKDNKSKVNTLTCNLRNAETIILSNDRGYLKKAGKIHDFLDSFSSTEEIKNHLIAVRDADESILY